MLTARRGTDHRPDQAKALVGGADAASTSTPSSTEGFEQFYREYMPLLVHQAMKTGRMDRADAADIAQEAMISVYQRWKVIDSPRAYASTVTQHMVYHRRAWSDRQKRLTEQLERDPLLAVTAPGPDHAYGERDLVENIISRLPRAQRDVVTAVSSGMRPAEVAELLGMSASTVRTHLQIARRKLIDQLTADNEV